MLFWLPRSIATSSSFDIISSFAVFYCCVETSAFWPAILFAQVPDVVDGFAQSGRFVEFGPLVHHHMFFSLTMQPLIDSADFEHTSVATPGTIFALGHGLSGHSHTFGLKI
jgi:hypothetical protein